MNSLQLAHQWEARTEKPAAKAHESFMLSTGKQCMSPWREPLYDVQQ